jgi:hypothetical protein
MKPQSEMESEETCGFQEFNLSGTKKMWIKTFESVEYVNDTLFTSRQVKLSSVKTSRDLVDARGQAFS